MDLGERLNGIQEVRGSIPLISTNNRRDVSPGGFLLQSNFCRSASQADVDYFPKAWRRQK